MPKEYKKTRIRKNINRKNNNNNSLDNDNIPQNYHKYNNYPRSKTKSKGKRSRHLSSSDLQNHKSSTENNFFEYENIPSDKRRKHEHRDDSPFSIPGFRGNSISVDRQTVNRHLSAVSSVDGKRLPSSIELMSSSSSPSSPSSSILNSSSNSSVRSKVSRDISLVHLYRELLIVRQQILSEFTPKELTILQQRSLINQALEPRPVEYKIRKLYSPPSEVIVIDDEQEDNSKKDNNNNDMESNKTEQQEDKIQEKEENQTDRNSPSQSSYNAQHEQPDDALFSLDNKQQNRLNDDSQENTTTETKDEQSSDSHDSVGIINLEVTDLDG